MITLGEEALLSPSATAFIMTEVAPLCSLYFSLDGIWTFGGTTCQFSLCLSIHSFFLVGLW